MASEKESQQALNMKPWFFWYLYRPVQGGVLALILLTLMNSQLITLQKLDAERLKSFYTLVAFGFLCGFGSLFVLEILLLSEIQTNKTYLKTQEKMVRADGNAPSSVL